MTVSPQWPQDGNRQPSVGGSGVESGDSVNSPTLPPTLFQLPNLNQEARGHAQSDQASIDQASIIGTSGARQSGIPGLAEIG